MQYNAIHAQPNRSPLLWAVPPASLHRVSCCYFWHGRFGGAAAGRDPPPPPSGPTPPPPHSHPDGSAQDEHSAIRSRSTSRIPLRIPTHPEGVVGSSGPTDFRRRGSETAGISSSDGGGLLLARRRRVSRPAPAPRRRLRRARLVPG